MRRKLAAIMCIVIWLCMPACAAQTQNDQVQADSSPEKGAYIQETANISLPLRAGPCKIGFAVVSTTGRSTSVTDSNGNARADCYAIAVLLDRQERIVNCYIDLVQSQAQFDAQGKVLTQQDVLFQSKNELETQPDTNAVAESGKEWSSQARFFADYVTGKTIDEVKGIPVNEYGVPADMNLAASVNISVMDMVSGLEKAVLTAQDLGADGSDRLGVGIIAAISDTLDAGARRDGQVEFYAVYAAATFTEDGMVTSCIFDSSRNAVLFDNHGNLHQATVQNDPEAVQSDDIPANQEAETQLVAEPPANQTEQRARIVLYQQYVVGKTAKEISALGEESENEVFDLAVFGLEGVSFEQFAGALERAFSVAV